MAVGETNGDAPSAIDEFKPPPGVVLPPREIRKVLEKTAGYVARNGSVFEDRIREKERSNPKFSFLDPDDAYYAFYSWRLDEVRSGRGTDISAGRAGDAAAKAAAPAEPQGPPKPPDFQFSARMPHINQKDLDVIRLTALFTAKHGRQFMTQLQQRETANPQFQFLIPNHTFHNFFQHIVEQYTTLLRAGGLEGEGGKLQDERVAELEKNLEDKFRLLNRARDRAEYSKFQDAEKQKKEEQEAEQKAEFARVDWGDFVVVETINFNEDDDEANLPPPTSLSELQYASLEDRNKASISASMRIEEAMPGEEDWTSYPPSQLPSHPAPHRPNEAANGMAPTRSAQEEEEERQIQNRADARARMQQAQAEARNPAPIKIRENYVPRAAQKQAAKQGTLLCPNCKQQIPTNELEEHMRIELLDPRWKEQKAKADARYASSSISQADVASNLKRLASQRSDVFDPVTGQAVSEEERARRKKAALTSFDGNPDGKGQHHGAGAGHMQTVNVEEQIRAIHQKFAEKKA